jgi:hypothetical protein
MARELAAVAFPATVICDNREQRPFPFEGFEADAAQGGGALIIPVKRGTLRSGDYSLEGFENLVACERKSIDDLFNTIGQGRRRFEDELKRLNVMKVAAVVVEADWHAILNAPPVRSQLPPKIVFRSVLAWQQRYPTVHWWFMPDRRLAEVVTFRLLERFLRDNAEMVWGARSRRTHQLRTTPTDEPEKG